MLQALGFLLAVAELCLPIDKITIVLSALGMGIGLDLQQSSMVLQHKEPAVF